MRRLIFLTIFSLATTLVSAAPLQSQPVPGGVAAIALPEDADIDSLRYRGRRVLTVEQDGQTFALIGLSLSTKPGKAWLTGNNHAGKKLSLPFEISGKSYKE